MAIQKIISVEGATANISGGVSTLTADRVDLTLNAGTLQWVSQDRDSPISTVRFLPSVSSGTNQFPQALTGTSWIRVDLFNDDTYIKQLTTYINSLPISI
jgi:hypothetical protein